MVCNKVSGHLGGCCCPVVVDQPRLNTVWNSGKALLKEAFQDVLGPVLKIPRHR